MADIDAVNIKGMAHYPPDDPLYIEPWIGVDLDGTLAHYDGWKGVDHIGEPIGAICDRVRWLIKHGVKVKIFTARAAHGRTAIIPVQEWCLNHVGVLLEITCSKDWGMVELWDDRVVLIERNTGRIIASHDRGVAL